MKGLIAFGICALAMLSALPTLAQKRPVHVFLAGDSTMAAKADDERPETGWGERLEARFSTLTLP